MSTNMKQTTEHTIFSAFQLIIFMTYCHQYPLQFLVFLTLSLLSDHFDRKIDKLFDDAVNYQECSSSSILRSYGRMTLAAST